MKNYVNGTEKVFVQVEYDDWSDNPREWSNLWNILTWTSRCDSIDSNQYRDLEEFLLDNLTEKQLRNLYKGNPSTKEFFERIQKRFYDLGYLVEPISRYEHGQVVFSVGVSQGWDSGVVGLAMVNIDDIKKEYETTVLSKGLKEKILGILDSELETYNLWVNGEVYTVSLLDFDGSIIDSLSGMIGYDTEKDMIQEYIDYYTDYNFKDFENKELQKETVTKYFVED